ncbi:MAG: GGDEF domain-containing protein [Acidimicrobiia bacterium]
MSSRNDSSDLLIRTARNGVVIETNSAARAMGFVLGEVLPEWLRNAEPNLVENRRRITDIDADLAINGVIRRFHFVVHTNDDGARFHGRDISAPIERERARTHRDPLTGLPNVHAYEDALVDTWSVAKREGWNVGFLYIDVNGLKFVNDTYGHDGGNALICSVSHKVRGVLREHDDIYRVGGDEFVAIIRSVEADSFARVEARARSAAHALCTITRGDSREIVTLRTSAAIGGALVPHANLGHTPEVFRTAIAHADAAMYEHKMTEKQRYIRLVERMARAKKWPIDIAHSTTSDGADIITVHLSRQSDPAQQRRPRTAAAVHTVLSDPNQATLLAHHVLASAIDTATWFCSNRPHTAPAQFRVAVPDHSDLAELRHQTVTDCMARGLDPDCFHLGKIINGRFWMALPELPATQVSRRVRPNNLPGQRDTRTKSPLSR